MKFLHFSAALFAAMSLASCDAAQRQTEPTLEARAVAPVLEGADAADPHSEQRLMLGEWIYEPGLPANVARPDPAAFAAVDEAVKAFAAGGPPPAGWTNWTTAERLRFLNRLPRTLPSPRLDALEGSFRLKDAPNNEVLFAWLELAVANRYDPAVPSLERFLTSQGRGKFVRPLILALADGAQWGRPIAQRVYRQARPLYHPIVRRRLDPLELT